MIPLKYRHLDILIPLNFSFWDHLIIFHPHKNLQPISGASGSVLESPLFIHLFNIYFVPTVCQGPEIQR